MNFYQLLTILNARKWLALFVFFLTVLTVTLISLWLPKSYVATTALVVNYSGEDVITGQRTSALSTPGYMGTQMDIINSQNVALKVVNKLGLYTNPAYVEAYYKATEGKIEIQNWLAGFVLGGLQVIPSKSSNVITIGYQAADPKYAATLANAFAESYVETNLEMKTNPSRRTSEWFKGQVEDMRQNLVNAQEKLSEYQRKKVIVSIDERLDVEMGRLSQLSQQLVVAQSDLFNIESQLESINKPDSRNSALLSDPIVRDIKAALSAAEVRIDELKQRVSRNHPDYISAASEIRSLKAKFYTELALARKRLENSLQIARQSVGGLEAAISKQKQTLLDINANRNELDVLKRDVTNAEQVLTQATQRLSQTTLESDLSQSDVSILTKATPPLNSSKPKVKLNIILSMFLGLILGVGFALLAELLNRKARTVDDLNNIGIPLLGEISYSRQAKG
ncbi:chain length determinant protein EpsF [Thiomicrorhabdus arctica]|uniref:chain length determinant protein EpsF n=1 Tax=Thiomicrorhabdus arctica TaxID=131540 RepID=UPI00035F60EB|nr:chain length determinant protein EpsF [Thiomicrorhabdus arctica]